MPTSSRARHPIIHKQCSVCGDVNDRDATEYELAYMITPVKFIKKYNNHKWTGEYICTRCNSRNIAREKRRKDVINMPEKLQECRAKHGIVLRIVRGLPACIKGSIKGSEIVHQGIGCSGCRLF